MNERKSSKTILIVILTFVLILIVLRLAAPTIITWYVNQTIEKTEAIVGSVDDVDIALIEGAYSINGINIRQAGDTKELPLFVADKVEFSLLWSALIQGKLVSEINMIKPTIGLYDRPDNKVFKNEAITDEKTWIGLARNLTPFSIDKLTVENGTFTMNAESQLKRSTFSIENMQLMVTNIANSKEADAIAQAEISGDIQNKAHLTLTANFDPNTTKPNFDMNMEMEKLPVSYIDSLIKFYAPFDFEAGQLDMASEMKSSDGQVTGYIEVGVYKLDVFSWHGDFVEDGDNPITLSIDLFGGMLASIFENSNKDLVATRLPIEGSINSPDLSSIDAFWGLLHNAFIEAYNLKVDHSINR